MAELFHEVAGTAGALYGFARLGEDALDLFVQFAAVGDDGHAGIRAGTQVSLGKLGASTMGSRSRHPVQAGASGNWPSIPFLQSGELASDLWFVKVVIPG